MKKKLSLLLAFVISVSMIATACGNGGESISGSVSESTTSATTTAATTEATSLTTEATTTEATTTTPATTTTAKTTTAAKTTTTAATSPTEAKTTLAKVTTAATTTAKQTADAVSSAPNKYVYNSLSADGKAAYDAILKAAKEMQPKATFAKAYDGDLVMKAYKGVLYQEPAVFWLTGQHNDVTGQKDISSFNLYYKDYTKEQIVSMEKVLQNKANTIKASIPAGASTFKKLQIIHDYEVLNSEFSKDGTNAANAYGPLVDGTSQCMGYAAAMGYMCNYLGIENVFIPGINPAGSSHGWNKVKVNGAWYNIDCTWDDPESSGFKKGDPTKYVSYTYFLVPDSQIMGSSHKSSADFTPPTANSTAANYFVANNLYATSAQQGYTMMLAQAKAAAKKGYKAVQVKCDSQATYDALKSLVTKNYDSFKNEINATAGVTKVSGASFYAEANKPKTYVLQLNLVY